MLDAFGLDRDDAIAVGLLSLATLIVGVVTIAATYDKPGDGPNHALMAYAWSRHPWLITNGDWLPGFTYLAGLCMMVLPHPATTARLYNLALSTASIAAYYALVRGVFDQRVAILSTIALAMMPMRIALGASSLTEAGLLFFTVAGCLLILRAFTPNLRFVFLSASLTLFVLAEMTRYEAWALIPLIIAYVYARSRSLGLTLLATAALTIFPLEWSIATHLHTGKSLHGISVVVNSPDRPGMTHGLVRVQWLLHLLRWYVGWLLPVGMAVGLAREFAVTVRARLEVDRAAYAILTAVFCSQVVFGLLMLGNNLIGRYLLVSLALAMPYAMVTYLDLFGNRRRAMGLGAFAVAISFISSYMGRMPRTYVTRRAPRETFALASWLENGPYRDAAVLMTEMYWRSLYLPLYSPHLVDRYYVVSNWVSPDWIRDFVEQQRPRLLITIPGDTSDRSRIADALGRAPDPSLGTPLHTFGDIEVYDISTWTANIKK